MVYPSDLASSTSPRRKSRTSGELGEVRVDVLLGFFPRNPEALSETVGLHPVEQAEVDHLRRTPLVRRHRVRVDVVDSRRRRRVNIEVLFERVDESRVVREMGEDAQLDLRVVGDQEHAPFVRDERLPDRTALLGPDRDVLQVRLFLREPAGRCSHLVEPAPNPAVLVDQAKQCLDVGAAQLLQLAVQQEVSDDLVFVTKLLEHRRVRRGCTLRCLLQNRKPEAIEQDLAELQRRVHVEGPAGCIMDQRLELRETFAEPVTEIGQEPHVDTDAGHLHPRQDRNQRKLHVLVEPDRATRRQLFRQRLNQALDRNRPPGGGLEVNTPFEVERSL